MQAIDAVAQSRSQDWPSIDWDRVRQVVNARQVMPVPVSIGAPDLDQLIASIKPEKYDFEPYGIEANDASPPTGRH